MNRTFHDRHLGSLIGSSASRHKVRLILGARQTGKTALLRHSLSDARTRFFNLQETDVRRRFEADPGAFGREVRALPRSTTNVAVDEIQKVPALLEEVQALYDEAPTSREYFLTGSSARRLRRGTANLLPGRSHAYLLFPVCSWEVEGSDALEIAPPRRGRVKAPAQGSPPFPRRDLAQVLRFGSLPGVIFEPAAKAALTLKSYVAIYLEEEIRSEALVRDVGAFDVFLRLAASESGRQVNLLKLSQESRVPASSLKNYYQTLVDTFVGSWITPYTRRTRKRLLTTPRFCFFDVGVSNAAADVPFNTELINTIGGPLLERWVGQELLARAGYSGDGHRVSFWRTSTGVEVDYVWETPREDVPIEVKWTSSPRPEDARHLEIFLDEYTDRSRRGLVVCRCPEPQQLTPRVKAIPWDRL